MGGTFRSQATSGDSRCFRGVVQYTFVDEQPILGQGSVNLSAREWNYTVSDGVGRIFSRNVNNTTYTFTLFFETATSGRYEGVAGNLQGAPDVRCRGNFTLQQ